MKPTLVILAAGMGSRYGGLKQLDEVGPNGEAIIDYSLYDAIRAGFGKVVFIIRRDFEEAFKKQFDAKLQGKIEVEYVFQELTDIPEGFSIPEGREKPWGTGHAIRAARNVAKTSFAAINADDFYGYEAYETMADFLSNEAAADYYSMVGYRLDNTLSDNGSVSRGLCITDDNQNLTDIDELTKITKEDSGIFYEKNGSKESLEGNETVSMNFWGFHPSLFKYLEEGFTQFLKAEGSELKSEFFIPMYVDELIKTGKTKVKVLTSDASWFGVTYKEDKPDVISKINSLTLTGKYPGNLW
ncbi:MAG: sugar phosphate nucleotidyltransferase [Prolixibacteraceae bacterium]|jgi:NDP-sugar pyrophosphorylase family protein|nr:sugar phosphate nucleotidyltransferase [Prolixibacteraceae bacterium]